MNNELNIISSNTLVEVNGAEIDQIIGEIIEKSKGNLQEIEALTLESVSLLTSAEARAKGLKSQKTLSRLWNNFTGKNDRIRNAIAESTAAAQYAAQQTINRVLVECSNNQRLALAINDRLNTAVLALQEEQVSISTELMNARKAIIALHQDYNLKIEAQDARILDIEETQSVRCGQCNFILKKGQIICPYCGEIHSLKVKKLEKDTRTKIEDIAALIQDNTWDPDAHWSLLATSYAKKIYKAEQIATHSGLLLDTSLQKDIQTLIEKCSNAQFQIAVVGILKAGKSMLMNSLIGIELAPTGLNSTTAALTKFRSSSGGHYVKVRFYTETEWHALKRSAQTSGMPTKGKTRISEPDDESLQKRLQSADIAQSESEWVGHAPIEERFTDIESFQAAIKRWTAANSSDHLFAAEVEVGVNKALFDMPEEVVFVDTPGLKDPVKYRSEITKNYIERANAVLIAVEPRALSVEGFETITTVLEYTGGNKKKVFIVGTQKDKLQNGSDYDTLIEGKDGWIQTLVDSKRYKSKRELESQIFTTSAYLHLTFNKVLRLSADELDELTNDEYTDMESSVRKVLGNRRYALDHLRDDEKSIQQIQDYLGIELLKKQLQRNLISKFRELKNKDIHEDFIRCKNAIQRLSKTSITSQSEQIQAANSGASELAAKLEAHEGALKDLDVEKENIETALKQLRAFTSKQLKGITPINSDNNSTTRKSKV